MLSVSETSLVFGIAYDSGYCHCERKRSNQQAQNPQKKRTQSYGEAIAQRRFGFYYL